MIINGGGGGSLTWRMIRASGESSLERQPPAQHLVGHHADRVEVGRGGDVGGQRLLGRHVGGRADGHPGRGLELLRRRPVQRLGDPEVGDLDVPLLGDQEVLRLEVAVHDVLLLGGGEAGEEVVQDHDHLLGPQLAHVRAQRAAAQVLHRDVRRALGEERLIDDDDVRVAERAGDVRLAQEALDQLRILGAERRQLLERHQPLQIGLARQVDRGHAAAAQLAQNLVSTDRETSRGAGAHRGRP